MISWGVATDRELTVCKELFTMSFSFSLAVSYFGSHIDDPWRLPLKQREWVLGENLKVSNYYFCAYLPIQFHNWIWPTVEKLVNSYFAYPLQSQTTKLSYTRQVRIFNSFKIDLPYHWWVELYPMHTSKKTHLQCNLYIAKLKSKNKSKYSFLYNRFFPHLEHPTTWSFRICF